METLYNLDKTPSAEPSFKRNIVPNAKRSENFTSLPWRAQPDSLCGYLTYSLVHLKKENKFAFVKKYFHRLSIYYFLLEIIEQLLMFCLLALRLLGYLSLRPYKNLTNLLNTFEIKSPNCLCF